VESHVETSIQVRTSRQNQRKQLGHRHETLERWKSASRNEIYYKFVDHGRNFDKAWCKIATFVLELEVKLFDQRHQEVDYIEEKYTYE